MYAVVHASTCVHATCATACMLTGIAYLRGSASDGETEQLIEELAERPYVFVGFLAWLILVPLGITSAHTIRKKMGRHWRQLHKMTYAVAVLGWLHLLWLSRSDVGDAVIYGALFGVLLAYRLSWLKSEVRF